MGSSAPVGRSLIRLTRFQHETLSTHMGGPPPGLPQQPQPLRLDLLRWTTTKTQITCLLFEWKLWRLCACLRFIEREGRDVNADSKDSGHSGQEYTSGHYARHCKHRQQ